MEFFNISIVYEFTILNLQRGKQQRGVVGFAPTVRGFLHCEWLMPNVLHFTGSDP